MIRSRLMFTALLLSALAARGGPDGAASKKPIGAAPDGDGEAGGAGPFADAGVNTGNAPEAGPVGVVKDDAALVTLPGAMMVDGLAGAAAALGQTIPVPAGGPGVGADRIAEPSLGVTSRPMDPRTADPRGPTATDARYGLGEMHAAHGAVRDRGGRGGSVVVDPDGIPGTHFFEALTNIMRDGRAYPAGAEIELNFRGYEELVAIGAVQPIDWQTGEPIRIPPAPGAARY